MSGRFKPTNHHRRSIRLPGYDYSQPGEYFVTICAYERRNLFGQIENGKIQLSPIGQVLEREWLRLPDRFPFLHPAPFVVMPNHFHGILMIEDIAEGRGTPSPSGPRRAPADPEFAKAFRKPVGGSIPTIVRSFKASVTLRINRMINYPTPSTSATPKAAPVSKR